MQQGYYCSLFTRIRNQEKSGIRRNKHATVRFIPKLDNNENINIKKDEKKDNKRNVKGVRPIVNMKQL